MRLISLRGWQLRAEHAGQIDIPFEVTHEHLLRDLAVMTVSALERIHHAEQLKTVHAKSIQALNSVGEMPDWGSFACLL